MALETKASEEDASDRYTLDVAQILIAVGLVTFSLSALVQFLWKGTALFMRDAGLPSETIGLLYLAGLPWVLSFLCGPLVDRNGAKRFGHFRSWLLPTSAILILSMVGLAFLSPKEDPYHLIMLIALMSGVMGTQYIAVFGLMTSYLPPVQRVNGTTVLAICYSVAGITVGAGVLYFLADLGWQISVWAATAMAASTFILLLLMPLDAGHGPATSTARYWDHLRFLRDAAPRNLLILVTFINVGGAAIHGLQPLMLIDSGFSVSDAAVVSVLGTGAAGLSGAALSGVIAKRIGGYKTVGLFGGLLSMATTLLGASYFLAESPTSTSLVAFILFGSFAMLGIMPASKAVLMGYCAKGCETTDFSSFSGIEAISLMLLISAITGAADTVGYGTLLLLSSPIAIIGAILGFWFARTTSENVEARA
ncbi:MAG: MFS transporter [Pseudomonadota bacterium]